MIQYSIQFRGGGRDLQIPLRYGLEARWAQCRNDLELYTHHHYLVWGAERWKINLNCRCHTAFFFFFCRKCFVVYPGNYIASLDPIFAIPRLIVIFNNVRTGRLVRVDTYERIAWKKGWKYLVNLVCGREHCEQTTHPPTGVETWNDSVHEPLVLRAFYVGEFPMRSRRGRPNAVAQQAVA